MSQFSLYIWNFINKIGTQLLWLATSMMLARFLTPDDFGKVGVLSVIFVVANTLSESGLGGALVIQKEVKDEDCATIFIFNVVVSHILYLIIYLSAGLIERFYNIAGLADITKALSLVFVINAYGVVPIALMSYSLRFKNLCLLSLFSVLTSAIIAVILGVLNYGVYALVIYQIMQTLIRTIGSIIMVKYRFPLCFRWRKFKELFSFGFYTTLCGVIDTVYENLLVMLYGKFLNVAQAGYFSQAKKIEEASTQSLLVTVNNTSFPILARFKDDLYKFKKEANQILSTLPIIVLPVLYIICIYSKEIIKLLFGNAWIPASQYLSQLIIAGIFILLDAIIRNFIKAKGEAGNLFCITLIKRILACLIVFVSFLFSVEYIIYGYIVSAIIGVLLNGYLYSKIIGERISIIYKDTFKGILFTLPIIVVSFLIKNYLPDLTVNIILNACLFFLIYIGIFKYLNIKLKTLFLMRFTKQ